MIGRGRHNDIYLYEVTKQDLLFDDELAASYQAGNVLMFADKRTVALGAEFARAEDLAAAREYLTQREHNDNTPAQESLQPDQQPNHESPAMPSASVSQALLHEESLREFAEKIEQRDELLRDLAETLKTQRRDNELLHEQLEQARAQLAVDEIRHNELVGDLQHVSEETYTIENTLEKVIDEKFMLEQELAERITELVELSLQNDDLRRQLIESDRSSVRADGSPTGTTPMDGASPGNASVNGGPMSGVSRGPTESAWSGEPLPLDGARTDSGFSPEQDSRVLTMASGKKIHILHEFPAAPRPTPVARVARSLVSVFRIVAIALFAVLLLATASIVTTAQVNGITYGSALDLVLRSLNLS
jgi:hypothetical protein